METILKKLLPKLTRMKIKSLMSKSNQFSSLEKKRKKIIIALAADYGNLGDVAITYAQKKFLMENFKDYEIVELFYEDTVKEMKSLKRKISKDDIITIVGGGNLGNLYQEFEDRRKFVIKNFKHNPIISFPQTMDFSSHPQGVKAKESTQKVYNHHPKLLLFAREKKTYDDMTKLFTRCQVEEMPDIVFYLNKFQKETKRENQVILCMRDDKEKAVDSKSVKEIEAFIMENGYSVDCQNTHIGEVKIEERENQLEEIWKKFSQAKFVVTDRLHGMIFCVITKTPCIVFNNTNGKVKYVYDRWIKGLDYIQLVNGANKEQIKQQCQKIEMLSNQTSKKLEDKVLVDEFEKMQKIIESFLKGEKR